MSDWIRDFLKHFFLAMEFFGACMLHDSRYLAPTIVILVIGAVGFFLLSDWDGTLDSFWDYFYAPLHSVPGFLKFLFAALFGIGAFLPIAGKAGLGVALMLIGVASFYFSRLLEGA